ncbi:hypothetical protein [Streptomyces sp. NPDC059071]|uniref:hypothetical protein n=1 Tax=unclassified Streptomyces TaxID=2593676 RepID=UPI00363B1881
MSVSRTSMRLAAAALVTVIGLGTASALGADSLPALAGAGWDTVPTTPADSTDGAGWDTAPVTLAADGDGAGWDVAPLTTDGGDGAGWDSAPTDPSTDGAGWD